MALASTVACGEDSLPVAPGPDGATSTDPGTSTTGASGAGNASSSSTGVGETPSPSSTSGGSALPTGSPPADAATDTTGGSVEAGVVDSGGGDADPLEGEPEIADEILDGPDVSVRETDELFTISNGLVTAVISKASGNMRSLTYGGMEVLSKGGYWSHDTRGGVETRTAVTIDPAATGGDRVEVSVKAISGGQSLGFGPGAEEGGDLPTDIEIRYSLTRGLPGVYTYSVFEHLPAYGAASMAEARFVAGLVQSFDWISVDADRHRLYPEPVENEDKYAFSAVQSENMAFGFSSTRDQVGFWLINPTIEYLSGGPTKPELLCHLNTDAAAAPVVLNYWRSSHYGGASVTVAQGEHWTKVVGPFLLYLNEGQGADGLWADAKQRAVTERRKWPYPWVSGVDYPTAEQRGEVRGRLVLDDPGAPGGGRFSGALQVGLTHAAYEAPSAYGGTREIGWQLDAKHYQFWSRTDDGSGRFVIPDVRPGTYTLHAFADGVLGEYVQAEVTVEVGQKLDLGELRWTPVRRGRQLWDLGVANRTATEFRNGERYFDPGIQLEYPQLFPDDVHFRVGESDPARDWYFLHIPHDDRGVGAIVPYRGLSGEGRATPFTVHFALPEAPAGTATLRLALCGTEAPGVGVYVNGTSVGPVLLDVADGVITRHQAQGLWYERELSFDAGLLKAGENTLVLNVPEGSLNRGVVYDYVRLELDD